MSKSEINDNISDNASCLSKVSRASIKTTNYSRKPNTQQNNNAILQMKQENIRLAQLHKQTKKRMEYFLTQKLLQTATYRQQLRNTQQKKRALCQI